jgi:hypothetical protein
MAKTKSKYITIEISHDDTETKGRQRKREGEKKGRRKKK